MAKVTSKLQVTIPKALADQLEIRQGDEIEWIAGGDALRLRHSRSGSRDSVEERLRLFDEATRRQRRRGKKSKAPRERLGRGWTREELYRRGSSR
jgi:AbrB family looped-hinge helix DNA binding protein